MNEPKAAVDPMAQTVVDAPQNPEMDDKRGGDTPAVAADPKAATVVKQAPQKAAVDNPAEMNRARSGADAVFGSLARIKPKPAAPPPPPPAPLEIRAMPPMNVRRGIPNPRDVAAVIELTCKPKRRAAARPRPQRVVR